MTLMSNLLLERIHNFLRKLHLYLATPYLYSTIHLFLQLLGVTSFIAFMKIRFYNNMNFHKSVFTVYFLSYNDVSVCIKYLS